MLYMMPLTFSFDAAQKDVPYIYYTINPNNLQMCRKTVIIAEEKILSKTSDGGVWNCTSLKNCALWPNGPNYTYPTFILDMDCFICSLKDEQITLNVHDSIKWITLDQQDINWIPADIQIIEKLKERGI